MAGLVGLAAGNPNKGDQIKKLVGQVCSCPLNYGGVVWIEKSCWLALAVSVWRIRLVHMHLTLITHMVIV